MDDVMSSRLTMVTWLLMTSVGGTPNSDVGLRDIYTGEHLDDVVIATDGSGLFTLPTVLVLYSPTCADSLVKHHITMDTLPPLPYMVGLSHDYVTFRKYIWFDQKEGSDLKERFKVSKCPTALFFEKGAEYAKPTSIWNSASGATFTEWSWNELKYTIKILNKLDYDVEVKVQGSYRDGLQQFKLQAGEVKDITAYPSLQLYVSSVETGKQVALYVLDGTQELTIENVIEDLALLEIEKVKLMQKEREKEADARRMLFAHAERWSMCIKQPLFCPRFTDAGYEIRDMPRDVYSALISFYNLQQDKKQEETWMRGDAVMNQHESPCDMVMLCPTVKATITPTLKYVLEKWCKCSLVETAVYGIRVYNAGSILRHHVDRIQTHVVSAILRVAQSEDKEGWPLEIITPQGRRVNATLQPGQMVLYESATLIHGRPYAFKGKGFANVFAHFKPHDWGYSRTVPDNRLVGPTTSIPLFPLTEPNWFWKQHLKVVKDEL